MLLAALLAVTLLFAQLLITRAYALAVVFITGSALLIAGGGPGGRDWSGLLAARALDTVVGCVIALAVFIVLSRKSARAWLRGAVAATLRAAADAVDHLAPGAVVSASGLEARRDLEDRLLGLARTYRDARNGYRPQRREASGSDSVMEAAERIGVRVLARSWSLEEEPTGARDAPPSAGLRVLADRLDDGRVVQVDHDAIPAFLAADVAELERRAAEPRSAVPQPGPRSRT